MGEAKLHSALERFVSLKEAAAWLQDRDGEKECYRCKKSYQGDSGECLFHKDSYILKFPARQAGLVIGRAGSTIAKIARESGARLDIQDCGPQLKEARISGTPLEVERAERMVRRLAGGRPGRWECCKAPGAAAGSCGSRQGHVEDRNFLDRREVVATGELDGEREGKVVALDCEMVKTWRGGELARVTVLDWMGTVCYESLVQPPVVVGDFKTKFSGLTPQVLEGVTTTLKEVQGDLVRMIAAKDIIVGHALHEDMTALHLEHGRIVDTQDIFPHPDGPPKRRSLRFMAKELLGRNIQLEAAGHDSKEDALAALDIIKTKVPK